MAQKQYYDPTTGEPVSAPDANASAAATVTGGGVNLPRLPGNQQAGVNFGGVQKRADDPLIPPPPTMSTKDKFLAAIPGAMSTIKSMAMDPEVLGGTAGAIIGGEFGFPVIGAGLGTAAARTGRDMYENASAVLHGEAIPNPPMQMGVHAGTSLITGMAGEGIGRGLTKIGPASRFTETGPGRATGEFFTNRNVPVMANQLTDSHALNFMANVAKHGPGGKDVIEDVEKRQSEAIRGALTGTAHKASPTNTISIAPGTNELDLGAAGGRIQDDIAGQVRGMSKTSGYDSFLAKHGDTQETKVLGFEANGDPITAKGPKMRDLHETRSAALETGRSKGFTDKARKKAMERANKATEDIERTLPDTQARQEYRDIADRYKGEANRLKNPTVNAVRKGKTNDVVDDILNSNLKNYESRATGTGHTNVELLGKIEKAAHPEAWQQLQADVIQRVGDRSVDQESGNLSADAMQKLLHGIDDSTQKKLFGPHLQEINKVLGILKQSQKFHKDEAGRLFIAIRTGGAITSAATGAVTGNLGKGLAGSAIILGMPTIFAKVLISPTARPLLIRALGKNPTIREAALREITKWVARNVTESAREAVVESDEVDNTIPEPPQQ